VLSTCWAVGAGSSMVMSQTFRQSPVSYLGLAVCSESLAAADRVGFRCRFSLLVAVKRLLPFKRPRSVRNS